MKNKESFFKTSLKSLLNQELSEQEAQSLKDEGYEIKKPTRKAAIMVALYKKAVSGDLSAIKELRSIVNDSAEKAQQSQAVTIIDDLTD